MSLNSALRRLPLLLAVVICSACERESPTPPSAAPTAPSPTAPSPGPSPPTLVVSQIEGRVIDADLEEPVPGARVTTDSVCHSGCRTTQPYSTVADENGMFRLTANLPQDWEELMLEVTNPGYEPSQMYLRSESATNAVLRAYRSITVHAGESVRLRVLFQESCAFESIPCRRIFVEASADESIDLEVFPVEAPDLFGVMVEPFPFSLPPVLQTTLTVRGGEAWIVRSVLSSGTGMATVVARRH
jgi:carboxypeptidase family protein